MARFRTWQLCVALLALTVGSYWPVWQNDFVNLDDEPYITNNSGVTGGLTWGGFSWAWTNEDAPYWHPLTWLTLQFDAQFFSTHTPDGKTVLCPAAFHGQNLFWHAASVLLLFGWWYHVTGACGPSFLVAGLFAVHPMHVESVAWAIERKDVLSGFFGVVTLWAYVRYLEKPTWLRYLLVPAAFLASLLAKPMLLTLPCVLLLLDYWPFGRLWPVAKGAGPLPAESSSCPSPLAPAAGERGLGLDAGASPSPPTPRPRSGGEGSKTRAASPCSLIGKRARLTQLILEKIPLFALVTAFAIITLELRDQHGALVSLDTLPLTARLANALTGYGWYVAATFCPWDLAALYPHPGTDWSPLSAGAGAGVLVGVSALALWQARRRPWLLVGWLWFVGTLVPVIGLAQGGKQAWADRFSYWPHLGLFAALSYSLAELSDRLRVPTWAAATAGAVVLACLGTLTWIQLGYWHDSGTLWEHALAVTRDNERAHLYLSSYYRNQGQIEKAEEHRRAANQIQFERWKKGRKPHHHDTRDPAAGRDK
jgi:hypothetical protein